MNVLLNKEQQKAYDILVKGHNLFLTGPSGTGKSTIINKFRQQFQFTRKIAITSTTGISALLIGGTTLHSYLGIGLGTGTVEKMADKIIKIPYYRKRWTMLNTLIVDEVSMLSPVLFDKLEEMARIIRKNELPFGGIQLIFSGDFLQLPVVNSEDFLFEAESW